MKDTYNNLNSIKNIFLILTSLLLLIVFTAEQSTANDSISRIRLQLKWKNQFQFAGYYVAQELGFFHEEGLDIELLERDLNIEPSSALLNGSADFAVDSPSVMLRRQQGAPLVVLAAIFQHSPNVLITLRSTNITSPHDLRGKRVMFTPDYDVECAVMLAKEYVSLDDLEMVAHNRDIDDLVQGRVDAMSGYLTNEPFILWRMGKQPHVIQPLNYGIDFYGDCLVTTESKIRDNPQQVEAFLRAVRRGWNYAMANPEETVELIHSRYIPHIPKEQLLFEAKAMHNLIRSDFVEIGHMNPERWRQIANSYAQLGLIPQDFDLSGFIYTELKSEMLERKEQKSRIVFLSLITFLVAGCALGSILFLFNTRLSKQVKERTAALSSSERQFRAFFEMAGMGVAQVSGLTGHFVKVNDKFCQLMGYSSNELFKLTDLDLTYPVDRPNYELAMAQLKQKNSSEISLEKRHLRKDGSMFWGLTNISPLWTDDAQPDFYLLVIFDLSARKNAEEKLQLANTVFEHTDEGILVTDPQGKIIQVNPGFTTITGFTNEEAFGQNPRILKSGRHTQDFYREMWEQSLTAGHWSGEIWNQRKNGEVYPEWLTIAAVRDETGQISSFVSIFHDMTEQKRQQEVIQYQAQHDTLTGLPNRVLLTDRMCVALAGLKRSNELMALLFLDLDNFKTINDGLGHDFGNALLLDISQHLSSLLRSEDTLARLGGDEFVILLSRVDSIQTISHIARRLLDAVKKPFHINEIDYFITCSIGITVSPNHGNDASQLIKNAEMAMYLAKNSGRNNFQFFTHEMNEAAHLRISLESKLRKAIKNEQFELFYQPLVNMKTGQITGAEALVRWRCEGRIISPADFIPLAEESGLILPLGDWILSTAVQQAKKWQDAGMNLTMSVNISSRQFASAGLITLLGKLLADMQLHHGQLYFEITESMIMGDMAKAQSTLQTLREAGGTFFLDDFGTGYSSLSYLKRLPIDGLKIDRSFIRDITDNQDSLAIVTAIISMAQTLNLRIVAEGVETEDQRRILGKLGDMTMQGYLASPPVPVEQFENLLAHGILLQSL